MPRPSRPPWFDHPSNPSIGDEACRLMDRHDFLIMHSNLRISCKKNAQKLRCMTAYYSENKIANSMYESVSKSFRTGRLERELQMVQLSATRCSCIAILWVSLVSFVAPTLCVASQRVFVVVVYFVIDSVRKLLDTPSYISPWRWRQHSHPKRWYPTTTLHGVTTQKTPTWIYTEQLTRTCHYSNSRSDNSEILKVTYKGKGKAA
jgi:hypothetical protein